MTAKRGVTHSSGKKGKKGDFFVRYSQLVGIPTSKGSFTLSDVTM